MPTGRNTVGAWRAAAKFVGVSGLGWLLDLSLFMTLSFLTDLGPLVTNLISAGVAVTFVFLISARYVFMYEGQYLASKLLAYVAFNIVAILAASAAIGLMAQALTSLSAPYLASPERLSGIAAKLLVTPVTLLANFLFSRLLLEKRGAEAPHAIRAGR
ncbi:MAG TPA: GtrA family protein [Mesorhizobium sp.]|nr:GtrA family protein [Mesorhizobium sp.]